MLRRHKLHVFAYAALLCGCLLVGCGSGETTRVITPGGPYQPTAEEQKTIDFVNAEMESRNRSQTKR